MTLSLLPSMEVAEMVVHWVEHGDLAHGEHERSALGSDEHGCTGTFHLCGCHTASATLPAAQAQTSRPPPAQRRKGFFAHLDRDGVGAQAPPIRPPIA